MVRYPYDEKYGTDMPREEMLAIVKLVEGQITDPEHIDGKISIINITLRITQYSMST